ncbi:Long-chain-fatty-acid--CoA ligase [Pigmentiphaga humi]|uniref:Long-chain-fatty-acid--CoA ligase n=1 Tax=Pigmentiphaga humi TaxID=2478468 RepID=A0A3P4AXS2_9BURK|nr:AMP-binding protein [Pigmentiphaga humi]VCU68190.1 Long-chain-fatty-acid--CoA ligase [Pigmentiphaga humi]
MGASPDHTFAQRLEDLVASRPDACALIDRGQRLSFRQLQDQVQALAAGLAGAGMRPGDRVALWLPNCTAWVVSFLACARLGAVVLAVNTRFRSAEVADILGRGKADWLLFWPTFKGIDFPAILDEVPSASTARLRGLVAWTEPGEPLAPAWRGHRQHAFRLLAAGGGAAPAAQPNAGVLCFTTSGTTSLPKFVLHDQRTLLLHGDAVGHAAGYGDGSCVLASAPFCGAFGFATLAGALAGGVPLALEPVFSAVSSVQAIRRYGITHTYANNEALMHILQAASPGDLASARLFGFASFAPDSGQLFALADAAGLPLAGLYGSSELQALLAVQPADASQGDVTLRRQPGGVLVHPRALVRARDPQTGALLPHGQSGEIEIRSPSLMLGYLDQPEETRKALTHDGYFRTGDLGYTVSVRQFVFQARMGDSLRLAGFLVNPAEIESVVAALPGVRACQVVGANRHGKTVPFAFVLLEPGSDADEQAWHAACRTRMAGFKVPAGFAVLDRFPSVQSANSVKIQKNKLRELADAILRDASSPAPDP